MRRLLRLLLVVLLGAAALELVLQVGALAMALLVRPAARPGDAAVLCVGDSYTFGAGASSPEHSYPAQLEARLRERGLDVQVANAGFPGQHSADVLKRLPGQLTPATRVLCILVGANDEWRRPARLPLADLPEGAAPDRFELVWRTGRLWQLLRRFDRGSWGRASTPEAAAPAPAAPEIEAGFRLLADTGLVSRTPRTPRYPPSSADVPWAALQSVWKALESDPAAALRSATELAAQHPDLPPVLQAMVDAAVRAGQPALAAPHLERLKALAQRPGAAQANECLARALLNLGHTEDAAAAARSRAAEEPLAVEAWDVLQQAEFVLGHRDPSVQAMAETLNLLGAGQPARSAFIARNLARWHHEAQPGVAAQIMASAFLLDGDIAGTRICLTRTEGQVRPEHFAAALAKVTPDDGERVRGLGAFLDEFYRGAGNEAWHEVLAAHLRDMVAIARPRGIQVVFLCYPFYAVAADLRAAAQALGAPFVPIHDRFEVELKTRSWGQLFVADGHCNDAGYALMGTMAADVVAPLLAR